MSQGSRARAIPRRVRCSSRGSCMHIIILLRLSSLGMTTPSVVAALIVLIPSLASVPAMSTSWVQVRFGTSTSGAGTRRYGYQKMDIQNFVGVQFASGRTEIQPQCRCGYGSLFVTILICTRDTHQWRDCNPAYAAFCMASCESEAEVAEAEALGYRCFHVTPENLDIQNHVLCPASDEAGKKTTCDSCGLCAGNYSDRSARIPHVRITVHGRGARLYKENHHHDLRYSSSASHGQSTGGLVDSRES